MNIKIGNGYDVHKLEYGRKLILGGVHIPYEKGLLGHSDADVLTHAIMDSLLGASKKGDIGGIFPDTDNKYKDICSIELLKEVGKILEKDGYSIINIDTIIVAQKPKIMPYVQTMEGNISKALNMNISQINIKATTEEGLGFTGECKGISSSAVCLLSQNI